MLLDVVRILQRPHLDDEERLAQLAQQIPLAQLGRHPLLPQPRVQRGHRLRGEVHVAHAADLQLVLAQPAHGVGLDKSAVLVAQGEEDLVGALGHAVPVEVDLAHQFLLEADQPLLVDLGSDLEIESTVLTELTVPIRISMRVPKFIFKSESLTDIL